LLFSGKVIDNVQSWLEKIDHPNPELNPSSIFCMLIFFKPSFGVVREGRIYQTGIFPDL
jgi:hypothetical protein